MEAMRLASEQQLTRDCLTGAGGCGSLDEDHSPSLESLTTLLWATHVFEKNRQRAPEPDIATEVKQACRELEELLRPREVIGRGISFQMSRGGGKSGQKAMDGWRPAFKHDRH
jgi:transcriptional activator HAC1